MARIRSEMHLDENDLPTAPPKQGSGNGKGDKTRPLSVSRDEYDRRWAQTFGGKRKGRR